MKLENWENVVYSWMNSWNFTQTPIMDIGGLFDQEFYTSLFKELGEKTTENMHESIMYFLKDEYIGFNIESEIWSEQDSILFTSLVLFTASMKSHNLRTPLFNLPSATQLSIQAFLQKLISKPAQEVNYDTLLEIINDIDDEYEICSPGTPILRFQTLNFETPEHKQKERSKLKSLQCKLDLVEWEKQHLQEETDFLKNELETLKKKYDVKEHDVLKLESELYTREKDEDYETNNVLMQAKTEEKRLKNRILDMEQTMESMRTDLYRALTAKSTLESNLEISEEREEETEKRCMELEEKVNMLTTHVQDLETLVFNLKQTNKEQSELLMEKMHNKSLNASIASFDCEGETLATVVEMKYLEAENTICTLRAELQECNDEKNELLKKLENITPNKTELLHLKQQLQDALDNIQDLKEENEYLRISLEKKNQDIDKLNKELELKTEIHESSSTDSGLYKSDIFLDGNEKLLDKIAHLNSILDGKQMLLDETNGFVNKLKREMSTRDHDITSLLEELSLTKLKLNKKQQQICELNKEIIDKSSEIENLQEDVSKYKSELTSFKNKLRSVELEAENLKGDLRVKDTTVLALEQNLYMNDHERSILERRINLLKIDADKVDLLKTEVNNLKKDVSKLNQEISIHKIEKEHLTVKLEEKEKNKDDFDSTFADLEKRMKRTHDLEIKHLTEEFNVKINTLKKKMIKDKCHIEELSSELWEASDKYLLASQESSALRNQLQRTKATLEEFKTNQRNQDYKEYDERLTYTREIWGSSSQRFPIDNDYNNSDEIFNDACLEDLKAGVCRLSSAPLTTRASYPVHRTPDSSLGKMNDRQSLIPFERPKKIKNTINYSRPGPPTPVRNRLSLQGLDRIEKIVKETEKITVTRDAQPRRLSRFFKPSTKGKPIPEPPSPKVKRKSFFMRTFGSNKENLPHN